MTDSLYRRTVWRVLLPIAILTFINSIDRMNVSFAAQPYGLHYAPDPSSQSICTIGGNVAFNSGGAHCLKYGMTSNHVLGVKVVTASGEPPLADTRMIGPWLVGAKRITPSLDHAPPRASTASHKSTGAFPSSATLRSFPFLCS